MLTFSKRTHNLALEDTVSHSTPNDEFVIYASVRGVWMRGHIELTNYDELHILAKAFGDSWDICHKYREKLKATLKTNERGH